jgi:hypothetical protein
MTKEKEKAIEFIDLFKSISDNKFSKAYAIICLEEIIGALEHGIDVKFYRRVKQEIQKL